MDRHYIGRRQAHRSPSPPPPEQKSRGPLGDVSKTVSFGEDIDFVIGLTATALAADQLLKAKDSKKHKKRHLAKAGIGAAAAAVAFTLMRREHREQRHQTTRNRDTNKASESGDDTDDDNDRSHTTRRRSPARLLRSEVPAAEPSYAIRSPSGQDMGDLNYRDIPSAKDHVFVTSRRHSTLLDTRQGRWDRTSPSLNQYR